MRTLQVTAWCAAVGLWLTATATAATVVTREPATIRLGERILVDDGSCPAGQIREIVGVSAKGPGPARVERLRQCVSRRR